MFPIVIFKKKEKKGDPISYLTERLQKQFDETEKAKEYAYNVERIARHYVQKWSPEDYLKMHQEIEALAELN